MQVEERTKETRVQKKRAKMAAKKLAKETGTPLPKKQKTNQPRKKPGPKREVIKKPKISSYVQTVARTHIELQRLMEEQKNTEFNITDICYPDSPAYQMEFYVSNNSKNLRASLEFPDEKITFADPKKTCPELHKMLTAIGLKAILARIETRNDENWICNSLRLFIHDKEQSPLFRYLDTGELPNVLENGSVRTEEAILTLDLILEADHKTKLYITNVDGARISVGSYELDETMLELDIKEGQIRFAKDIEYAMRCALCASIEGKLYKLAANYFEGDITAMFMSQRVIG